MCLELYYSEEEKVETFHQNLPENRTAVDPPPPPPHQPIGIQLLTFTFTAFGTLSGKRVLRRFLGEQKNIMVHLQVHNKSLGYTYVPKMSYEGTTRGIKGYPSGYHPSDGHMYLKRYSFEPCICPYPEPHKIFYTTEVIEG